MVVGRETKAIVVVVAHFFGQPFTISEEFKLAAVTILVII